MLASPRTWKAAGHFDLKLETVSYQMGFFWLSRARKICVKCWNHLIGLLGGRLVSPTKKTKSCSGWNWTVLHWPVHLVYSHERKKKYNPNTTRSEMFRVFWLKNDATVDKME